MNKKLFMLILLISLLSTGCGVIGATPVVTTSTGEPVPVITETKLPMPISSATPSKTKQNQSDANVTYVRAILGEDGSWTFYVTIEHPDTGWDDYVDGWDVVTQDGIVLKVNSDDPFTRVLAHPHVDEQPFTRSQHGIIVPPGITYISVRAHDIVDGFGEQEVLIDLGKDSGPGFEVER